MNKCHECNSCLAQFYLGSDLYLWCDFCDTFYHPVFGGGGKKYTREEFNKLREEFYTKEVLNKEDENT